MHLAKPRTLFLAAAFFAALFLPVQSAEAGGPFARLSGNWVGSGVLTMNGIRERIRCRAIYFVFSGGESLQQVLRCASDSYIIDVHAEVVERDGRFSGTWRETTSGVTGTLSGLARGPIIRGVISGLGFTAPLSLITRGRIQYASISLGGANATGVAVTFHRF